ncbi:hypothetical protein GGS20DRAFT_305481 [Poronia punctata]|nr:hypothetical protein GGS20DRAFT_305481 [Poronia punctata]
MSTIVTTATTRVANLDVPTENERPKKHHISTVINYYRDPGDGSPPAPVRISEQNKTVKNERPSVAKPTLVYDITGEEEEGRYTLDKTGFQFLRGRETQLRDVADFLDDEVVRKRYYPEVEGLLKDVTGATNIKIFDHKTRIGPSNWHKLGEGNRAARGPLFRAHVDQSYVGAEIVLRRYLKSEEADRIIDKGERWQIINIWRPIKRITRDPLAVADARSIREEDLVAASILYGSGSRDETWTILPGTGHEWFYKRGQMPDEPLLIKCFDSATTPGLARRAPHSAFVDPSVSDEDGDGYRESIEVRALVFYG